MRTTIRTFVLAAAAGCSFGASAQNCKNPDTQLAMNTCAAREYDREDARLNKNYRELVGKLEPTRRDKLREVQLTWLKFRDQHCEYQASQYEGGSMASMVHSMCLSDMTKQRNKDLKYMLEEASL